jgi:hypothetical protein
MSITLAQPIDKKTSIDIEYLFLPHYLIRYYRDPLGGITDYIGCNFSENLITAKIIYKWRTIQINPFVRYEIDNYKKNFDFYDGKALRFGFDGMWQLYRLVGVDLGFERKQYDASGPVPDISYIDDDASIEVSAKIPSFENISCKLGAGYGKRNFTTDNSSLIDPYHRDRQDARYSLDFGLSYKLTNGIQLEGIYQREIRTVSSPYLVTIDDVKNYTDNIFSFGIKFTSIKLYKGD